MSNYCCVSCKSAALPLFLLPSNALPAIACINPTPILLVSKIASLHAGAVLLEQVQNFCPVEESSISNWPSRR